MSESPTWMFAHISNTDGRQGVKVCSYVRRNPSVGGVEAWEHPVHHEVKCFVCEWASDNEMVEEKFIGSNGLTYAYSGPDVDLVMAWGAHHQLQPPWYHVKAWLAYVDWWNVQKDKVEELARIEKEKKDLGGG